MSNYLNKPALDLRTTPHVCRNSWWTADRYRSRCRRRCAGVELLALRKLAFAKSEGF